MTATATAANDLEVLAGVVGAVAEAGRALLLRFTPASRQDNLGSLLTAIVANDDASTEILRPALERIRPGARWDDDEEGRGTLGPGEWWVADAAEGNVNHIHGSTGWGVTVTLVRDDIPVLTAVYLPATGDTYTAVRGHGAFLNGEKMSVSPKTGLAAALVGTGQAKPSEDPALRRRMTASVGAMLDHALLVSVGVPTTLQILPVAAGHTDTFWQYGQIRSGLVAGALLVEEAGGVVLDSHGAPWTLASEDFVATTAGLASEVTAVLSIVR
ncbi:inositol monophosphatase family protein [Rhodococcoides yunnanense]|uniref:Inositol monophosphatase family protein n=1 Tax=Rhodococcoides yunnanense TaxID=278209 RepID=A0ABU4BIE6_9NOCA|nr:inositol monophosphatase family protein [Rhodococcus yunnanensis]MDV6263975.1 inositol monophosphatase family protein [Rhodococcus yunnanensis]